MRWLVIVLAAVVLFSLWLPRPEQDLSECAARLGGFIETPRCEEGGQFRYGPPFFYGPGRLSARPALTNR